MKLSSSPSKSERLEERLLTSRWRSPASSSSRARRALWWRPSLPLQCSRTLLRHAPTPPWRAPYLLQTARRRALLRPPRALASTASAALGEGGAGSHLSGGARPPSLSSSSSDDDEYSEAAGGESPCCSRNRYSSSRCSRRSRRRILRSFLRAARSCSRRCAVRALGLGAWAGQTARRPWTPSAKKSEMSESHRRVVRE
jgi:hypothetical protein